LKKVLGGVQGLIGTAASLAEDDVTDKRFQLEDQKRRLAQQMFELITEKRLNQVKAEYEEAKRVAAEVVRESGNDREKHMLSEVVAREQTFIHSTSPEKIRAASSELNRLRWEILFRTPAFLKSMFERLVEKRASMNDQIQASQLIENGRRAAQGDDVDALRRIVDRLWYLMPAAAQESEEMGAFTGII
jgi:molecular chaperone DnaK